MIGYMNRVVLDYSYITIIDSMFTFDMIYVWCSLLWDTIPILSLLVFHYSNFKPHQHELIIHVNQYSELDDKKITGEEDEVDMLFIQDGMMGPLVVTRESIVLSTTPRSYGGQNESRDIF